MSDAFYLIACLVLGAFAGFVGTILEAWLDLSKPVTWLVIITLCVVGNLIMFGLFRT